MEIAPSKLSGASLVKNSRHNKIVRPIDIYRKEEIEVDTMKLNNQDIDQIVKQYVDYMGQNGITDVKVCRQKSEDVDQVQQINTDHLQNDDKENDDDQFQIDQGQDFDQVSDEEQLV